MSSTPSGSLYRRSARSLALSRCRVGETCAIASEYRRWVPSSPEGPVEESRTRRAGDEAHLHVHGRGAGAGDALAAADRRGLCRTGRRRHRAARHLAGGPHPRAVPGPADGRAAGAGRAERARRAGQDAGREHHQAAEHQRLAPAAQGGDQGAAGRGLRHPGLPGRPARRRREGGARGVRPRQGLGGQPGAARGQLRPACTRLGQGLRARRIRTRWARGRRTVARTWRR